MAKTYSAEYMENSKILGSYGVTKEKQLAMENGLKDNEILIKQRSLIQQLRMKRTAPKQ